MLTTDDIDVIYSFLDRVPITGHRERENMTIVVAKLQAMKKSAGKPTDLRKQNEDNS